MTAYEEENKSLREEVHRLSRKESELLNKQYDLERKIEILERMDSNKVMCPTVTPAEFAELLKREILRAISKFTRSFDGEMNLNVYKDENQYGFRFEFEHL